MGAFLPYVGWSPSLSTISEELNLNYSQAGGISSITGLVAGVMILIGGVVASRWGAKNVIACGLAAGVVGQAAFAMADGFELILVARVLAGISVGFLWVATYTMAVNWFRDSNRTGRALGVMLSGDGMGAVLSLFVFSAVLAAFGWRMGLVVQAVLMSVVLLAVLFLSKNAPAVPGNDPLHSVPADPVLGVSPGPTFRSVMNRNVLSALLVWIGGVGLFSVIASWMPAILVEDGGMSESLAGFLTALFSIAGSAAALSVPIIAERLGAKKKLIIVAGFVTTGSLLAMTTFLAVGNYVLVAAFVPLIGIGVYAAESLTLAEAIESVLPRLAGVVNGITLGIPWIVSGFAYPYLLGAVKDSTGSFVQGFVVLIVATTVLCAVSPFFIREGARAVEPTTSALKV
ncbi:MFS transporter [Mycolicibacterium neoaurum]|uniref:MFS transporter n=1 Tax=Mycolicibacterium neoaurum TaxID=1795 RepID=UPI0005694E27|nr:MFS transporter [Mycolicibacterium neoaurum]